MGKVTLPEADLALTLGEDGKIEQLHGTAQAPFPSFGLLGDARRRDTRALPRSGWTAAQT